MPDAATTDPATLARACVTAGVTAADPERAVRDRVQLVAAGADADADTDTDTDAVHETGVDGAHRLVVDGMAYDLCAYDRILIAGAGKAAGAIARGLEAVLAPVDSVAVEGLVVTDRPAALSAVTLVRGAHPVPDERSLAAAARLRATLAGADARTLVLAPVTGGGSALLAAPASGLDLAALRTTTAALVDGGADIDEINAVRKHLSAVKGGQLADVAAPATVVVLAVSDVIGDDPSTIASGPFAPDPTTYADALAVLDRYDLAVPDAVRAHLRAGAAGEHAETPGPDAAVFAADRLRTVIIASARTAVAAAAARARAAGYTPCVLATRMRGEARECARTHVAVTEEIHTAGQPVTPPAVLLSAGEVTVTVHGEGHGGPNLEFALAAGLELPAGVALASVDTDGADGGTDAAGAVITGPVDPSDRSTARAALADNDAYPFLADRNALIRFDSQTNVNDLRAIVVPAPDPDSGSETEADPDSGIADSAAGEQTGVYRSDSQPR